jgi:hypothetical protein
MTDTSRAMPSVDTLGAMPLRDLASFVVFRFAALKKSEYRATFIGGNGARNLNR